ncbi:hypothetical protein L596_026383 [Steinernema carpocapsae]|uniref:Uncharacterized protein n=1 Tax=Steinernema carpocapsae TaxID=34508 RepID=A0A4V5ZY61_STECR|nr:hypothetical protein L596_026383 [Steinernema carpocapsae]
MSVLEIELRFTHDLKPDDKADIGCSVLEKNVVRVACSALNYDDVAKCDEALENDWEIGEAGTDKTRFTSLKFQIYD